jgi:uncharacterized protein YeaO (DUF488 family)
MKTTILKMILLASISTAGMTSCTSPEKKVEDATIKVVEAKQELEQARADSAEYAKYKENAEAQLRENDQKIADLKEQMKKEKKEIRMEYYKQLAELDAKNAKLKIRMQEYKDGVKNEWASFKQQFNEEMNEVGKSISAVAQKNMNKK